MNIGIIIQAHMGSTRLPGKVMKLLVGKPVLFHVVERALRTPGAPIVVVATSTEVADDEIAVFCKKQGYHCFRGSDEDVLSRYYGAAQQYGLDVIVRVTSDCPLIDPIVIGRVIEAFQHCDCDYLSNVFPGERTFPRGLDTEIFSFAALERANSQATSWKDREQVNDYIWNNKDSLFKMGPTIVATPEYARDYRLTVDYAEDFVLIQNIYNTFYTEGSIIAVPEVLDYLDAHSEVAASNTHCEQKI